jgi:hypothetical protein
LGKYLTPFRRLTRRLDLVWEAVMGQTDSRKKLGLFELQVAEEDRDVAYLRLPSHPGETCRMSKSIRLVDLMGSYTGPDVVLDFDQEGVLVGIEILA